MCANSDVAETSSYFGDVEFKNEKYLISYIDLDIITKFVSTNDLNSFIKIYNVKKINVGEDGVEFLTDCFQNLCNSIITAQTYGYRQSSFSTLSNLILLLNLVDLDEGNKRIIETSFRRLVSDKKIVKALFSRHWPDFKITLQELSKLCRSLSLSRSYEIVHNIITSENFFEYASNVNFDCLRQLVFAFLPNDDKDISTEVKNVIDMTDNFRQKVILIRLFYQYITNEVDQRTYKEFLSTSFLLLPTYSIYDFVFSGWLTITSETAKAFLKEILETYEHRPKGIHSFPDPVETKLECAYLLYINDIITDINILEKLAEGRPHLQFLINPESFDYNQVDFSDYMWENFAKHKKYMDYFVAHKDAIIPHIKERVEKGDVSEAEKKILYGFLLNEDEIWKI